MPIKPILWTALAVLVLLFIINQTDQQQIQAPKQEPAQEQTLKQKQSDDIEPAPPVMAKIKIEQPNINQDPSPETDNINPPPEESTEVQWKAYLDKESKLYRQLLTQSEQMVGAPVVIGPDIYFRLDIEGQTEFSKLNKTDGKMILEQPYEVYNKLQQSLNENENLGEWSQSHEYSVRDLFSQFYTFGAYTILSLQCRENACLLEFDFDSIEHAEQFIKYLRYNRNQCQCIPMEILWPQQLRGVIRFEML